MVHGSQSEEPSLSEAPSVSVVVPSTGRGKLRLSGSLSQLILQAFESPPRKVLSLLAVKEFLTQAGYAVTKNSQRLKRELRNLVSHGLLVRVTGSGASASFRLNSAQAKGAGKADPGKKKAAAPKKAAAGKREHQKKPRKKQSAAAKAKGPQSKAAADPGKKQLRRRAAAAAKKVPRRGT